MKKKYIQEVSLIKLAFVDLIAWELSGNLLNRAF